MTTLSFWVEIARVSGISGTDDSGFSLKTTTDHKPATLHDVARAAGVSAITASRALGNPAVVSARTIEKVRLAVEATGYRPNLLAGGLRSRRSMTVAALVPAIAVQQFLPTVQALTQTLGDAGYQVVLGQAGYDHAREEALLDALLGRQPDGIVVTGLVHSTRMREALRRLRVPVVETWDLTDAPVDMLVGFSHREVGKAVAGFLRDKGWTRVGLATGDDQRARERCQGFRAAFDGPVPMAVVPAPSSLALGRRVLGELLARAPALQAVFCSSDTLAQGVMVEAQARGLRVPQDLAVCGFGDADFAAHVLPSLSTVQIDGAGIGRRAAEFVLQRCRGQEVRQQVVDIGFRIVDRASTGGVLV